MVGLKIVLIEPQGSIEDALYVRRIVFQEGQQIAESDDFDGNDEAATHVIAYVNEEAVGTGRLRKIDPNTVKIERVAVLEKMRGKGIGKDIMHSLNRHAATIGVGKVTLDAQSHAKPFYEGLGYQQEGEEFMEVGIPHVVMTKKFN